MTIYRIVRFSPLTGRKPVVEYTVQQVAEKRLEDYRASATRMQSLDRYELETYEETGTKSADRRQR